MSYDQGQVSTNLFQDVDSATNWVLPINVKPAVPQYIPRELHYDRNTELQFDAISNRHVPQTPLSIHDAIPLFIPQEQRIRGPFTFKDPEHAHADKVNRLKGRDQPIRIDQGPELVRYHEGFNKVPVIQVERTVIEERHEQMIIASQLLINYHPILMKPLRAWIDSNAYTHKGLVAELRRMTRALFLHERQDYGHEDEVHLMDVLMHYETKLSSPFKEVRERVLPQVVDHVYKVFTDLGDKISRSNAYTALVLLPPIDNSIPYATTLYNKLDELTKYPRREPEQREQQDIAEDIAREEEKQAEAEVELDRPAPEDRQRDPDGDGDGEQKAKRHKPEPKQKADDAAPHGDVEKQAEHIQLAGEPNSEQRNRDLEDYKEQLAAGQPNSDGKKLSAAFVQRAGHDMTNVSVHPFTGKEEFTAVDEKQVGEYKSQMSEEEHELYDLYQDRVQSYIHQEILTKNLDEEALSFRDYTYGEGTKFEQELIDEFLHDWKIMQQEDDTGYSYNLQNHLNNYIRGTNEPTTGMTPDDRELFSKIVFRHKELMKHIAGGGSRQSYEAKHYKDGQDPMLEDVHVRILEEVDYERFKKETKEKIERRSKEQFSEDKIAQYEKHKSLAIEANILTVEDFEYMEKALDNQQLPARTQKKKEKLDGFVMIINYARQYMDDNNLTLVNKEVQSKLQKEFDATQFKIKVLTPFIERWGLVPLYNG
jgi:hypothetical protein